MTVPFRSVLLTPNILGADGVSCLSRQIARALPSPVMVVSLHDASSRDDVLRRSARGYRLALVADAVRTALRCHRDTVIVCAHVHLAPLARLMAWQGARVTYVLCGIEAWTRLRRGEQQALRTGRIVASEGYKGHESLIAIWPRVLERHPEARLWIAGDGDDRARLEALTARARIQGAVRFTGRIADAELDALYERCRFFVMPSLHEGFGLVFLEAMRAGKACIGAVGAAAEIIEDGVTGFVVDPARADDLAGAVLRLFDEPHTCEAFGRAGAARFRAEFTDSCFAERFAAVL